MTGKAVVENEINSFKEMLYILRLKLAFKAFDNTSRSIVFQDRVMKAHKLGTTKRVFWKFSNQCWTTTTKTWKATNDLYVYV